MTYAKAIAIAAIWASVAVVGRADGMVGIACAFLGFWATVGIVEGK